MVTTPSCYSAEGEVAGGREEAAGLVKAGGGELRSVN